MGNVANVCGRGAEIPGGVLIDRDDWTPENGLMSAVYKFVRRRIQARHADELRVRVLALLADSTFTLFG